MLEYVRMMHSTMYAWFIVHIAHQNNAAASWHGIHVEIAKCIIEILFQSFNFWCGSTACNHFGSFKICISAQYLALFDYVEGWDRGSVGTENKNDEGL